MVRPLKFGPGDKGEKMSQVLHRLGGRRLLALAAGFALAAVVGSAAAASNGNGSGNDRLSRINHIVVIYEENHSFDNLYGGWEGVNGLANASAARTLQINQAGNIFNCLMQNDVNLTSPPLSATCADSTQGSPVFTSHFTNAPFSIEQFIPKDARTCPQPGVFAPTGLLPSPANLPGGCTRDIVHRFYQEQYQLNGGAQNRYTTGSDAVGLTQGYYQTRELPIYQYLHSGGHPHYAIADDFFQSAFGGSFLNHQWLIAAASPVDTDPAHAGQHSIVDSNGMPAGGPLYVPTGPTLDRPLTILCPPPATQPNLACGDYAVNTIQPTYQPTSSNPIKLPPQTGATIGDELSAAGISWAWYSGGWSNADGDVGAPGWTNGTGPTCSDPDSSPNPAFPFCPNKVFQFHHQPFNYYANYAPGTPGRTHLRDEAEFVDLANSSGKTCKLDSVSFIKPVGLENEHPGYTSEVRGSDHLIDLLRSIDQSACAKDTMVIVTYDEFGGQWDHVSPPGQGTPGPADKWGPGTRIPALIVSPFLRGQEVIDHTQYDTTSILATIEERYGLAPLSTRDAAVNSLSNVYDAKEFNNGG
jgi:acid phosphatase